MTALSGVGVPALQWIEVSPMAVHVRRRLTDEEAATVGGLLDIRGTPLVKALLAPVRHLLPVGYSE